MKLPLTRSKMFGVHCVCNEILFLHQQLLLSPVQLLRYPIQIIFISANEMFKKPFCLLSFAKTPNKAPLSSSLLCRSSCFPLDKSIHYRASPFAAAAIALIISPILLISAILCYIEKHGPMHCQRHPPRLAAA